MTLLPQEKYNLILAFAIRSVGSWSYDSLVNYAENAEVERLREMSDQEIIEEIGSIYPELLEDYGANTVMEPHEFFEELKNASAVIVNGNLRRLRYYDGQDRVGDTTEPLVELFQAHYVDFIFSPSSIEKINVYEDTIQLYLKNNCEAYEIQILYPKKYKEE